jgi:hypothetical protein
MRGDPTIELEQFPESDDSVRVMTPLLRQTLSAAALLAGGALLVHGTILPEAIDAGLLNQEPYSFNGLIAINGVATGSASMVGKGIFATAAHVVSETTYPDGQKQFRWYFESPVEDIRYFPAYNTGGEANPTGPNFTPSAFYKWESYSSRVLGDTSGPGLTDLDTKNLDLVVGVIAGTAGSIVNHAEVNIDPEFEVSILRDRRDKMIVGYPGVSPVPVENRGLMHATIPGDYFCEWNGLEGFEELDSEGKWDAMYLFEGVSTYPGGSGGPIYVRDDLDNWVMSGIVSAKKGSDGMIVRGFDEEAWELVEQANFVRNLGAMRRVDNLSAEINDFGGVVLDWSDHASEESGYIIFRHFNGTYEELVTLPSDRESHTDFTVQPGHIYHYRVQPIAADGNRPPKSAEVRVAVSNSLPVARESLEQPWLQFTSDGDSTWFIDDQNRLRSGKVRSLGSSSLIFEIIGPGTLNFEWSVSSENNPEYAIEGAPDKGIIFDALYLYLDGEVMTQNNEPVFLSGIVGPESKQVTIPEGAHVVEWQYEKDPYTDEHDDAGYLSSVNWIPDAANPYPVFGGYAANDTGWHAAEWFGLYYSAHWPWILHEEFGWMYVLGNTGNGLYGFSDLDVIGYYYTSPELFPFLYLPETGNWLYYFQDTGYRGSGAWFWDFASNSLIQTAG